MVVPLDVTSATPPTFKKVTVLGPKKKERKEMASMLERVNWLLFVGKYKTKFTDELN